MQTDYSYFLKHARELSKKHAGKHVMVVDSKIVAIGKMASAAFHKAIKNVPKNKKIGIFYLPTKQDALVLL